MRSIACSVFAAMLILHGTDVSAGGGRRSEGGAVPAGAFRDSIPFDFPAFQVPVLDNPAPGKIFMCPLLRATPRFTYLTILDESIAPAFFAKRTGSMSDFKLQPNGLMTFFDTGTRCHYAMDPTYAIIDSFRCANGYETDGHDFQMTADGHALLMSYDIRVMDMSAVVPGGNPAAKVSGLVIQELNRDKQLVFEWKSWDHFAVTDATHEDLTAGTIDYIHANAFELDTDGNILLSARHMDEITKINRRTGDIMWRLGGAHNQFTFVNDTIGFSHQHDIRRLPNGNITMFDNGNFHTPPMSRAVEYRLDEEKRTAELVWEYRNTPDLYAFATGNVQRLANGNTLISWGTTNVITEVRSDGGKAMELVLSPLFTVYRTFRFPWTTTGIDAPGMLPATALLFPPYPNPFNPNATLRYQISELRNVKLSVFDVLGREIVVLVDEMKNPGTYSVSFDGSRLASGMYFCRMQTGGFIRTIRMLLLK